MIRVLCTSLKVIRKYGCPREHGLNMISLDGTGLLIQVYSTSELQVCLGR